MLHLSLLVCSLLHNLILLILDSLLKLSTPCTSFLFLLFLFFSQALRSRDSLQLEYTDCLLDKNRLRKSIAELQANLEQLQRELERERERSREQMDQSSHCLHCVSYQSGVQQVCGV